MTEVTLKVPEDRLEFFLQVFEQLGLEVSDELDYEISEEDKRVVLERIEAGKKDPSTYRDWKVVREKYTSKWENTK
jgi:hypothetical protein